MDRDRLNVTAIIYYNTLTALTPTQQKHNHKGLKIDLYPNHPYTQMSVYIYGISRKHIGC